MSSIIWPLQYLNGILTKITFFIAMVIVSIMVLALSASALTRYISGHGFDWFIELPPALVSWLVFPLLGPLLKTGSHIEVDFVSSVMTQRTLRFVKLFVYFISLLSFKRIYFFNEEQLLPINFSKKSKSFKAFKNSELNPTSTTLNFDL